MISELSFLIDLFMNHKLPRATKELIAQRIKEVEERLVVHPASKPVTYSTPAIHKPNEIPQPEVIAHTPAAAAAIAHREAIMSGKRPDTVQTGKDTLGPKKW
jgi:hypothetical protein